MSANATGTPTSTFSIPKFLTATDAPNGTGINEMMDAIDVLLATSFSSTMKLLPSKLQQEAATSGQVLAWNGTIWAPTTAAASGMTNPMTTTGDLIYSSSGTTPARRAIGSTGQILTVVGGVPAWAAPPSALVKGGSTAITTDGSGNASISFGITFATIVSVVLIGTSVAASPPIVSSQSTTGFTIFWSGHAGTSETFNWIAVGT